MHGINLGLLHQFISKEVLPAELGGTLPEHNITSWAKELVGDENFSFGDKHIYWPDRSTGNLQQQFCLLEIGTCVQETKQSQGKCTVRPRR